MDSDGDGEISFIEFALAVASRTGRLQLADDAVTAALDEAVRQAEMAEASSSTRKRKPRKTHAERFDEMLATAREWEEAYLCRDVSEDEIEEEGCATPEAAMDAAATAKGGRSASPGAARDVCGRPLRAGRQCLEGLLRGVLAAAVWRRSDLSGAEEVYGQMAEEVGWCGYFGYMRAPSVCGYCGEPSY